MKLTESVRANVRRIYELIKLVKLFDQQQVSPNKANRKCTRTDQARETF